MQVKTLKLYAYVRKRSLDVWWNVKIASVKNNGFTSPVLVWLVGHLEFGTVKSVMVS